MPQDGPVIQQIVETALFAVPLNKNLRDMMKMSSADHGKVDGTYVLSIPESISKSE